MDITIDDAIKKVRIAIDDIVKDEDKDEDFTADATTELKQAVEDACTRVSQEAPADYVIPKTVGSEQWTDKDGNADGQTMNADGSGYLVLPSDFLRFVELRLVSWGRSVFELLVPGSNEANMQASRWSRGNALKPKAMIANNATGGRILCYWTAGRYAAKQSDGTVKNVYNHQVEVLAYVPIPAVSTDGKTITVGLTDNCLANIIYTAAGIYMEGKKEATLADRFYALASHYAAA